MNVLSKKITVNYKKTTNWLKKKNNTTEAKYLRNSPKFPKIRRLAVLPIVAAICVFQP